MRIPLLVGLVFLAASCSDSSPGVPDALPAIDATPDARPALPDLVIVGDRIIPSISIEEQEFLLGDCVLLEADLCVGGVGTRRLLRFDTTTWNQGNADLEVGVLGPDSGFVWSSCMQHWHFTSYANYELLGDNNTVVVAGHKQAFCLMDTDPMIDPAPAPRFSCSFQGISAGWADTYDKFLDCQWIDITGVAPGDYTLRITINTAHILPESDYTNNVFETPVTLP